MPDLIYWKDGKKIECKAIYENGHEGRAVVLHNVSFGKNPDREMDPLAGYNQPAIFTILKRTDKGYILVDQDCHEFLVPGEHCGNPSCSYLYDATEWAEWAMAHHSEKMDRKDKKIEHIESQIAMLKDILIKQGFRVISEAQAKQLGL